MFTKKPKLSLITTIIAALVFALNIVSLSSSDYSSTVTYEFGLYVIIAGMIISVIMPFFTKKLLKQKISITY